LENSLYIALNVIAVVNIAILLLFLTARRNNAYPNLILAFILGIPGLYLFDNILICSGVIHHVSFVFFFVQIIANLFPLGVYYYVHLLLGDGKKYHPILLTGTLATLVLSGYVV